MVFGCADAITCDPEVTQCADTTHTASGLGSRALNPLSAFVKALSSIAFIGDPCPTNNTGIFSKPHFLAGGRAHTPAKSSSC